MPALLSAIVLGLAAAGNQATAGPAKGSIVAASIAASSAVGTELTVTIEGRGFDAAASAVEVFRP